MSPAFACHAQRLLIIDNHPIFAEGVKALFCPWPFALIDMAFSVDEAAEHLSRAPFDLVLVDLTLPEGRALSLAEQIVEVWSCSRILFLDDRLHVSRLRAALRLNGAGYWTKEASAREMLEGLWAAIQGQESFCPAARPFLVHTRYGLQYRPPKDSLLGRLSLRESQILALLTEGYTVKRCAERLKLSPYTVENHKARLMKKLGVHKLTQLVLLAAREGW